jgi:hypothetical protein
MRQQQPSRLQSGYSTNFFRTSNERSYKLCGYSQSLRPYKLCGYYPNFVGITQTLWVFSKLTFLQTLWIFSKLLVTPYERSNKVYYKRNTNILRSLLQPQCQP